MASRSTGGGGTSSQCAGCHKMFRRLSTHIAQSPICEQLYTTSHDFISCSASNNVATQSSTLRRSGPCLSNDLPSVTHPHVGSLPSIRKTANGSLGGKTNVLSSRGNASSGVATSKEKILEDRLKMIAMMLGMMLFIGTIGEDDVVRSQDADEVVAQPQTNKKKRRRY